MWKIMIVGAMIGGLVGGGSLLGAKAPSPELLFPGMSFEDIVRPPEALPVWTCDSASCWHNGKEYSEGATICRDGRLLKCVDGMWQDAGSC